jgi:phosphoribosylaminoimidazole-succinocarboxamide synthase
MLACKQIRDRERTAGLCKQYLRDWLKREGLRGKQYVKIPKEVVNKTAEKYREVFEKLTRQK